MRRPCSDELFLSLLAATLGMAILTQTTTLTLNGAALCLRVSSSGDPQTANLASAGTSTLRRCNHRPRRLTRQQWSSPGGGAVRRVLLADSINMWWSQRLLFTSST